MWNMGAAVGAVVWFGLMLGWQGAAFQPFRFVHQLVLVGPLVIVPLSLGRVVPAASWTRGLFGLWAIGAVCAGVAVRLPQGKPAAALAAVWGLVTGALALLGLWRAFSRFRRGTLFRDLPELCIDAALVYIPVGAIWLIADRLAMELMGFPLLIVVLTAAHFHFAGYAAPMIAGFAGRALDKPGAWWKVAGAFAIAGPPIVAAGITTSPIVEVIGSVALAFGMAVLACLLIFVLGKRMGGIRRALLTVAGLSILATMLLACLYAVGEYIGYQAISIPVMIATHGVANVFGFSALSLVAFALSPAREPAE